MPHGRFGLARINDQTAARVSPGQVEIALADFPVELGPFGFHAIEQGAQASGGGRFVDVENDVKIGQEIARRHAGDGRDIRARQAAGGALIRQRARDISVGQHQLAPGERGADAAIDQLGPRGHVEQHLAADGYLEAFVSAGEQHAADLLADRCAAGLANFNERNAEMFEQCRESASLCALPGAVGPFQDDEAARTGAKIARRNIRGQIKRRGVRHAGTIPGGGAGDACKSGAHGCPSSRYACRMTMGADRKRLATDTDDGMLVIISGPSGAGKTTITRAVERSIPGSVFSVSCTTRPKGEGDVDGVDYHFIDDATFVGMVARGEFLEHVDLFDKKYGTPRRWVEEQLARGRLVILEIDVVGAMKVKRSLPGAFGLFILPPSEMVLLERLRARRREDEASIQRRFAEAKREIEQGRSCGVYDVFIVNDVLDKAIQQAVGAVLGERSRRAIGRSVTPE
jgi:guanylate kinase